MAAVARTLRAFYKECDTLSGLSNGRCLGLEHPASNKNRPRD
jgi:hypothetical protein